MSSSSSSTWLGLFAPERINPRTSVVSLSYQEANVPLDKLEHFFSSLHIASESLTVLALNGFPLGLDGGGLLAAHAHALRRLTTLNLYSTGAGQALVMIAAQLRHWPLLDTLEVTHDPLDEAGVAALAEALRAGVVPQLQRLNLAATGVTAHGAAEVARALVGMPSLEMLSLSRNPIGDRGVEALMQCLGSVPKLADLRLQQCGLGADGLACLVDGLVEVAPPLDRLAYGMNEFGDDGLEAFAARLHLLPAHLKVKIDLGRTGCGDRGLAALAASLAGGAAPGLRELKLNSNKFGDDGVCALADAFAELPALQYLDLNYSTVSVRGARAVALRLPKLAQLSRLSMYSTRVGREGAQALACMAPLVASLSELDVEDVQVGSRGVRAIEAAVLVHPGTLRCKYGSSVDWNLHEYSSEDEDVDDMTLEQAHELLAKLRDELRRVNLVAFLLGLRVQPRPGEHCSVLTFAHHPTFDANIIGVLAEFVTGQPPRGFVTLSGS